MNCVDYDKENDILYIKIDETFDSYGEELDNDGFITLRDIDTDKVTGITILDFMKKYIKI